MDDRIRCDLLGARLTVYERCVINVTPKLPFRRAELASTELEGEMTKIRVGSSLWREVFMSLVIVALSLAAAGEVKAFGGRPTPVDPSAPTAPDGDPERIDKPVEDPIIEPIEEPTELPIFGIELPPEDIWSEPELGDVELVTTGAPAEPHQLRDVPEPSTVGLAVLGLLTMGMSRRIRRANRS